MKVKEAIGWALCLVPKYLTPTLTVLALLVASESLAGDYPPLPQIKPTENLPEPKPKVDSPYGILSEVDIQLYMKIFHLQKDGNWKQADVHIASLSDQILMGHVWFQRYMHPTSYRSTYSELSFWMRSFRDHPGATRIYRLARRRQPGGQHKLARPSPNKFKNSDTTNNSEITSSTSSSSGKSQIYRSSRKRSVSERRRARAFMSQIRSQIRREILTKSEKQVRAASRSLLDSVETDQLFWEISSRWYFRGDNDKKAFELSSASAKRSRAEVEIADWTAGLAAWRLGKMREAQLHFESLADSEKASSWNAAAGAYWAARANLVNGHPEKVNHWLEKGSKNTRTFYGLLSQRLLGKDETVIAQPLRLDAKSFNILRKHAAVRRAIALTEIDQSHLADQEIRQLISSANSKQAEALLTFASNFDLPASTIQLALKTLSTASPLYDATAYPIPNWDLGKEGKLDRALVYAFIRQESRFNTNARSRVGARGLMQLMPRTASFVAKDRRLIHTHRYKLHEPDLNLKLGQGYLRLLMNENLIGKNLFLLAAAYNAGPGNLNKWMRKMSHKEDPLLFIESIPSQETRLFVERVVTSLWVYRLLLSQDTPSLDEVVVGRWPHYAALDGRKDTAANQLLLNSEYPEGKTIANR